MRRHDADAFGGVHRAAAADRDQPVAALRAVFGRSLVDQRNAWVGSDLVEHDRLDVGSPQRLERDLEQPGGLDPGVGHEQRPAHGELTRLVAELLDGAEALHEARRALVSAKGVLEHR